MLARVFDAHKKWARSGHDLRKIISRLVLARWQQRKARWTPPRRAGHRRALGVGGKVTFHCGICSLTQGLDSPRRAGHVAPSALAEKVASHRRIDWSTTAYHFSSFCVGKSECVCVCVCSLQSSYLLPNPTSCNPIVAYDASHHSSRSPTPSPTRSPPPATWTTISPNSTTKSH